jgi:hypothetical protein
MGPEASLPRSQKPSIGPFPQADDSSIYNSILFL